MKKAVAERQEAIEITGLNNHLDIVEVIMKTQTLDLFWIIVCRWDSPLDGKHGH